MKVKIRRIFFLNIAATQYSLNRKTLEIYLSGCYGRCPGCHNSELWDFAVGDPYKSWFPKLKKKMDTGLVDVIWILGGDPLDQPEDELLDLVKYLKEDLDCREIWIWTRHPLEKVSKDLLSLVQYLKIGPYEKEKSGYVDPLTGVELASSNQKIIKVC